MPLRYSRAWFEARGGYIPPALPDHMERQAIIGRDLPTFHTLPKKIWAGMLITDTTPTEGRHFHPSPEDESLYAIPEGD